MNLIGLANKITKALLPDLYGKPGLSTEQVVLLMGTRELVKRAYEVVHHDDECPAIGGCGDKDCRCDAVPFLRELESLLSGGSHA